MSDETTSLGTRGRITAPAQEATALGRNPACPPQGTTRRGEPLGETHYASSHVLLTACTPLLQAMAWKAVETEQRGDNLGRALANPIQQFTG